MATAIDNLLRLRKGWRPGIGGWQPGDVFGPQPVNDANQVNDAASGAPAPAPLPTVPLRPPRVIKLGRGGFGVGLPRTGLGTPPISMSTPAPSPSAPFGIPLWGWAVMAVAAVAVVKPDVLGLSR